MLLGLLHCTLTQSGFGMTLIIFISFEKGYPDVLCGSLQ